jgi:L,D-peptidoglycan transpeptidase YkuD (ErfK/YbiS/YcfS/YnhG family)
MQVELFDQRRPQVVVIVNDENPARTRYGRTHAASLRIGRNDTPDPTASGVTPSTFPAIPGCRRRGASGTNFNANLKFWLTMPNLPLSSIQVARRPGRRTQGLVLAGGRAIPCALGRAGIRGSKREGDGATPAGCFALGRAWWRADRGLPPGGGLPRRRIRKDDGWCDAPGDPRYNRAVKLPCQASHEEMWRSDRLYDLVVEIGWNISPRHAGRGSAIFLHAARAEFEPTAGCVALQPAELRRLIARLGPATRLVVRPW